MALAKKVAGAGGDFVPFGSLAYYSSGGVSIPPGKYALEFNLQKFQAKDQTTGAPRGNERLGVMLTAYPIGDSDPQGNAKTQFYSLGTKAIESFAPSEDGKKLVAKPGASGQLYDSTNWHMFLKSLFDCGLPPQVFSNDLSVLDGIWVELTLVPEPEERKGFGKAAATGEAAYLQPEQRQDRKVAVVTEILDGGEPWNGGGGMPEAGAAAPAAAPAPAAKPVPINKPMGKKAAAPAAAAAGEGDLRMAAVNALSTVLAENPNGITKIMLTNNVFKALAGEGAEVREAIINTYFKSGDDAMNSILADFGYGIQGAMAKPL